jgi:Ca2+-binding RTX toxin-like protein
MNTTKRPIVRLALIGALAAGTAATVVPGIASAGDKVGCAGKTIDATAHGQTLHGTCGNDTFYIRQFSGVTVYAGGGHDTVRAGFGTGDVHFYMEGGNDTVLNPNNREIWAHGGAGNDTMYGSTGYDAFYGGTGTDAVAVNPGDFYAEVESFL